MIGNTIDLDKVETIRNWSHMKNMKNGSLNNMFAVQLYVGFSNYYQRFIPKYSEKP